jgi:hypothetical protein
MVGTILKSLKQFFSKKNWKQKQHHFNIDIKTGTFDIVSSPGFQKSYWFPSPSYNIRINKIKKIKKNVQRHTEITKRPS